MRNSIAKGIAAIFVAGVLAAGVCCTGFASRGDDGKWFGNGNISTWHWNDKTDDKTPADNELENGGVGNAVVSGIESRGIRVMSEKLAVADYEDYGISEQAETAFVLTASLIPEDVDNKAVDWSVRWKDGSEAWASGKTVTDYITVTPTSNGALTASVECVAAFGSKIEVVCTSRDNTSVFATCTCDYVRRVVGVNTLYYGKNSTAASTSGGTFLTSSQITVNVPDDCSSMNFELADGRRTYDLVQFFEFGVGTINNYQDLTVTLTAKGLPLSKIPGSGVSEKSYSVDKSMPVGQFALAMQSYYTADQNTVIRVLKSTSKAEYVPTHTLTLTAKSAYSDYKCEWTICSSAIALGIKASGMNMSESNHIF